MTPLGSTRGKTPTPGVSPDGPARRLVSLQQAAGVLGVSVASARRLVWAGKLPAVRLTRRLQVDLRDLDRLIEQSKKLN